MKNARAAIAAALMSLTACAPSEINPLAEVRSVCSDLGYANGSLPAPSSAPSPERTRSTSEWSSLAERYAGIANRAAGAARRDARWNDLSNALTDFQSTLVAKAQDQESSVDVQEVRRTVDRECRKAQAE